MLCKGFYDNFSTKEATASWGLRPNSHQGVLSPGHLPGALPPDPEVTLLPYQFTLAPSLLKTVNCIPLHEWTWHNCVFSC